MNALMWMSSCAAASLIALCIATRIGVHDVRTWITPEMQMRLRSIGIAWQAAAIVAAFCVAWASQHWGLALLQNAHPDGGFLSLAQFLFLAALCGGFVGLLAALSRIDVACRLLPDRLTFLLIATGLAFHFLLRALDPFDALLGAAAGYGVLWMFAWLFQRIRKTEAMGRGDFAMTAGLGAWLGWQSLPLLLMIASSVALAAIAAQRLAENLSRTPPPIKPSILLKAETAFGPSLALGGLTAWAAMATGAPFG